MIDKMNAHACNCMLDINITYRKARKENSEMNHFIGSARDMFFFFPQ